VLAFTDTMVLIASSKLDKTVGRAVRVPGVIRSVLPASHRTWYLATEKGVFRYTLRDNDSHLLLPMADINAMCFNADSSRLLLGINSWDIHEFQLSTGRHVRINKRFPTGDASSNPAVCTSLFLENDSTVWVGTAGSGLYSCDLGDATMRRIFPSIEEDINCIYRSRDAVVWIGTALGGVTLIQREHQFFRHQFRGEYSIGNARALGMANVHYNNNVWSILPLRNSRLLLGTNGGGAAVYDFENDSVVAWIDAL